MTLEDKIMNHVHSTKNRMYAGPLKGKEAKEIELLVHDICGKAFGTATEEQMNKVLDMALKEVEDNPNLFLNNALRWNVLDYLTNPNTDVQAIMGSA